MDAFELQIRPSREPPHRHLLRSDSALISSWCLRISGGDGALIYPLEGAPAKRSAFAALALGVVRREAAFERLRPSQQTRV